MTLIERLTEETQSLKKQYLEMIQTWSQEEFTRLKEMSRWSTQQWADHFGITLEERFPGAGTYSWPRGFYNSQRSVPVFRAREKAAAAASQGEQKFMERAMKNAEQHYEGSIAKLAYRIQNKGLDESSLKMSTSHIGVNIETTITDGSQTVRAWTIIASGPIQRPHYRYLVK